MLQELESFEGCVISLHGRRQFSPLRSYYNDLKSKEAFNGFRYVAKDEKVTVLGTASTVWHSGTVELSQEDFPQMYNGRSSRNMADIWFSKKLNEKGIDRIVVSHRAGWIEQSKIVDPKRSIGMLARKDDSVQTELFNSVKWVL